MTVLHDTYWLISESSEGHQLTEIKSQHKQNTDERFRANENKTGRNILRTNTNETTDGKHPETSTQFHPRKLKKRHTHTHTHFTLL